MQLPLPGLLSPALERLRAAVADDDPEEVAAVLPAALAEVDTPLVRAGLVRAVQGCGTPGGCRTRWLRRWRSSRPAARPRCCAPACLRRWQSASERPGSRLGCWWSAAREPTKPVCGHPDGQRAAGAGGPAAAADRAAARGGAGQDRAGRRRQPAEHPHRGAAGGGGQHRLEVAAATATYRHRNERFTWAATDLYFAGRPVRPEDEVLRRRVIRRVEDRVLKTLHPGIIPPLMGDRSRHSASGQHTMNEPHVRCIGVATML
jgi:hypothetical protein